MVASVKININARELADDIEELGEFIEIANRSAAARIRSGIRDIILGSYNIALEQAGDGFPEIYARHLRRGLLELDPLVTTNRTGLQAIYYDIESLGTYADLQEGFHYHAIIDVDKKSFSVSNPQRVELPYGGEPLYNDEDQRYDFWQAIVDGQDFEVSFGKGASSHKRIISTAGLYQETLRARVNWWGNRYPEWLILEYGTEYYPEVPPTHIRYFMEQRVYEFMLNIYEPILDSIIDVWNSTGRISRNSANQLINEKGQYVKYIPDELRLR